MVRVIAHKRIVKKRTNRFTRFEYEDHGKMAPSWRKPHGKFYINLIRYSDFL